MRFRFSVVLCMILMASQSSCQRPAREPSNIVSMDQPSTTGQAASEPKMLEPEPSAKDLCKRLSEMKVMPYRVDKSTGDPVYDGLIHQRFEAVPCLIELTTDLRPMPDPREAPHVLDFKVGDAAVFMLHRITGEPLETILPNEFAKRWKVEGVYAYFSYVEKPMNRKAIKTWWINWTKNNLNN